MEHKNLYRVGVFACIFVIFTATVGYAYNVSTIVTPTRGCNPELDDECGLYATPPSPTRSLKDRQSPCEDPYHDEECYAKAPSRIRRTIDGARAEETVKLESYIDIFACLVGAQDEDDCVPFELAHTLEGAKKYQVMDTKVKYDVMQTHFCFDPRDEDTYDVPTLDTTCNLKPWATTCIDYPGTGFLNFCVSDEGETFECSPTTNSLLHVWTVGYEHATLDNGSKRMIVLFEAHIGRIYLQSDVTKTCWFVIRQDASGPVCYSECDTRWDDLLRTIFTRPAYAPWLSPDKVAQVIVHYNVEFSKVALLVEGLGFMEILEAVATGAAIGVFNTIMIRACMVTGGTTCPLIKLPAPV